MTTCPERTKQNSVRRNRNHKPSEPNHGHVGHGTPKRKRCISPRRDTNEIDSVLSILIELDTHVEATTPVKKRKLAIGLVPNNDNTTSVSGSLEPTLADYTQRLAPPKRTVDNYAQKLQQHMESISSMLHTAINKKDEYSPQMNVTNPNYAQIVSKIPNQITNNSTLPPQGFAENCLPPDVVDTWKQSRSDTNESGKKQIQGEWLQDSVVTQTIEPWAVGIEKVPQYLKGDPEFMRKLVDFRKETSIQLMDMASRHLLQRADIQKK